MLREHASLHPVNAKASDDPVLSEALADATFNLATLHYLQDQQTVAISEFKILLEKVGATSSGVSGTHV